MPKSIALKLQIVFALLVLFALFRWSNNPNGANKMYNSVNERSMTLITVVISGLLLSSMLIRGSQWQNSWDEFQSKGKEVLGRIKSTDSLSRVISEIRKIPDEPPTMYIEEQDQELESWIGYASLPDGIKNCDKDEKCDRIIAAIFLILAKHGASDAFVGRAFHDNYRSRKKKSDKEKSFGVTQTKKQSGHTYTYRAVGKSGRNHCVACFTIKIDNKIDIFYNVSCLWLNAFDSFRYGLGWFVFACISAVFMPPLVPIFFLYVCYKFPPSRGWTPLWCRFCCDTENGTFNGKNPSLDEEREMIGFRKDVKQVVKEFLPKILKVYS
jgi:hypothetical protein